MAGDRWEEGGKEKISRAVINSNSDLCGKMKDKFIKLKKVKVLSDQACFTSLFWEWRQQEKT